MHQDSIHLHIHIELPECDKWEHALQIPVSELPHYTTSPSRWLAYLGLGYALTGCVGRLSNSPVFVVGIYSGADKLGEGFGSSLKMAEFRVRLYFHRFFIVFLTPHLLGCGGLATQTISHKNAHRLVDITVGHFLRKPGIHLRGK